jgi:carotenoid cleavage dioxygenase-like enzyme
MNAFDQGDTVVLDVVRHSRTFDQERRGPGEAPTQLVRWTINLVTGSLDESLLDERGCEFPRFNDAFAGRPYRFGYTASAEDGYALDLLINTMCAPDILKHTTMVRDAQRSNLCLSAGKDLQSKMMVGLSPSSTTRPAMPPT